MSLGLKKALSLYNITKDFLTTGIFPLNCTAMDSKLMPSEIFQSLLAPTTGTIPAGRSGHLPTIADYNLPPEDEGKEQYFY